MNRNLLILGAGQYGLVAGDVARAMNCFDRIDFLDDDKEFAIGRLEEAERFASQYIAVVAIGDSSVRLHWLEHLKSLAFPIAKLVHPTAVISPGAKLEEGVIIEPFCVVHNESVIGKGTILSAGAVIDHNSTVEACCHIGCLAAVESGAVVPRCTKVENSTCFKRNS